MAMQDRQQRVADIQAALRRMSGSAGLAGLDGWLFYDFRHSDPIAYRILLLDPTQHVTRRWYYWVPAEGRPVKLSHRIEPHVLDALPGDTFESEIKELSYEKLIYASKQLSNKHKGEVETATDETGMEKPISTLYQAEAWLANTEGVIRPGMRGRAKIHAGYQTLGQRFWRFLTRTFNFKL